MKRILIEPDFDAVNPRDGSGLTKMVCFHKKYELGDEHDYRVGDFNGWRELEERLVKDGAKAILPLYLYDHSGLSMNTSGFDCHWDSGQVGFIYVDEKEMENFDNDLDKAFAFMVEEVNDYDNYLSGEYFIVTVSDEKPSDCSCCQGEAVSCEFDEVEKFYIQGRVNLDHVIFRLKEIYPGCVVIEE